MLREKFPEFCGSPSPPVGGAGPPTPSPASKGRATRAQAGRGVLPAAALRPSARPCASVPAVLALVCVLGAPRPPPLAGRC